MNEEQPTVERPRIGYDPRPLRRERLELVGIYGGWVLAALLLALASFELGLLVNR